MWIAGEPVFGAGTIGCQVKKLGIRVDAVDNTDRADCRRLHNLEQQPACHRKGLAQHHDDRTVGVEFSMLQHDDGGHHIVADPPGTNPADEATVAIVATPCGQLAAELRGRARGTVEIAHD